MFEKLGLGPGHAYHVYHAYNAPNLIRLPLRTLALRLNQVKANISPSVVVVVQQSSLFEPIMLSLDRFRCS